MKKILLPTFLLLSGCTTWHGMECTKYGAGRGTEYFDACMAADPDNFNQCLGYGAKPGTDAYVQCMATLAHGLPVADAAEGIRKLGESIGVLVSLAQKRSMGNA